MLGILNSMEIQARYLRESSWRLGGKRDARTITLLQGHDEADFVIYFLNLWFGIPADTTCTDRQ